MAVAVLRLVATGNGQDLLRWEVPVSLPEPPPAECSSSSRTRLTVCTEQWVLGGSISPCVVRARCATDDVMIEKLFTRLGFI